MEDRFGNRCRVPIQRVIGMEVEVYILIQVYVRYLIKVGVEVF